MAITNTLAQQIAAARDTQFQDRVEAAAIAAAVAIYNEAATTIGHAARAAYAVALLNTDSNHYAQVFARACAAQGLDATSSDAAIDTAVAAAWNAAAGA